MKILCLIQIYNEMETGHLPGFFEQHNGLFDDIIVFDDASTDGSADFARRYTDHVLQKSANDFGDEKNHKRKMLDYADQFNPDFIMFLDADEIFTTDRQTLESVCTQMAKDGVDGYKTKFYNLWRSYNYVRTDSLFDKLRPIKLFKYIPTDTPYASLDKGLHQHLEPDYVKNTIVHPDLIILHRGFTTTYHIIRKFLTYRAHGQTGFDLMRLIDESKVTFARVDDALIPDDWDKQDAPPTPLSLEAYFKEAYKIRDEIKKPKVSIFSLIYKDVKWLQFVYDQVLKHSGNIDYEFYFIANDATKEVTDYLYEHYIPHYIFVPDEAVRHEHYINNVYRAYNFGVSQAKSDLVVMINSDMAFSPGWLDALLDTYQSGRVVSSRLIEQGKLATGTYGIEKDFGNDTADYDEAGFLAYAAQNKVAEIKPGGLYMPILVNKYDFEKIGGYPEGNLKKDSDVFAPQIAQPGEDVMSGDVAFIEKLKSIDVAHVTAFHSLIYHFQEGEKRSEASEINAEFAQDEICIANNTIIGINGEKVLWNYLLEMPNTHAMDYDIVGGKKNISFDAYRKSKSLKASVSLQNASFMDLVNTDLRTITLLQDNLRRMGLENALQEQVLRDCDHRVTNSVITAASYPEFDFDIIPLGVDDTLFSPQDTSACRAKWQIDTSAKVGIFVGALNEVKGWPDVLKTIDHYQDIHWLVVTKYDDEIDRQNVTLFRNLDQKSLAELLNCADFFLLGSPVETQCLAAIEAALCDVPLVMRPTGMFYTIAEEDRAKIGYFGDDFTSGVAHVLEHDFTPRDTMKGYDITIEACKERWWHCFAAQKLAYHKSRYLTDQSDITTISRARKWRFHMEFILRRKIIKPLLGRDSLPSIGEISVFLKQHSPAIIFTSIRTIWRLIRRR
ncbi:MAG: glycosyltransferase [Candidatus Puniceispirillaceae bacterium]